MNYLDKTKAFMLIEPKNQATKEALNLPANARFVPRDHSQQPINAGPSDTTSKPALQLTIEELPDKEGIGYVFGSDSTMCDVLLDYETLMGVSQRVFSIRARDNYHHFTLSVLTTQAFHAGRRSELGEVDMERLERAYTKTLYPGETWIVTFGIAELALKPVMRDQTEGKHFNKNVQLYRSCRSASLEKTTVDIGRLDVQASTQETPDSRILTGVWSSYTTAGWATKGTMANITACISKTAVTCCIKEAMVVDSKTFLKREILHLRLVAHPSIIKYIDRDPDFAWMAVEFASLGNLEHQERKSPFKFLEIEVVIYQVLSALGHLHACNIVHHDINPENILVQVREQYQILVKVAGFGLSAMTPNNPGAYMGNASYLAPECFKLPPQSCGAKVDVWALAMVGLRLLFDLPDVAEVEPQAEYQAGSPFAEGWRGLLKHHFDQCVERYRSDDVAEGDEARVDAFFHTLSRMFDMKPDTRVGALEACQALRDSCAPGYFFSIGRLKRTLSINEPIPLIDTQRDDNSIFRFCQLDFETLSGPLLMLKGCYLVNLGQLIEVISQGKSDIEEATHRMLGALKRRCWRFKRTNALPEWYIRIEDALKLCQGHDRLEPLAKVLRKQRSKLEAMSDSPAPEGSAYDNSVKEEQDISEIGDKIGLVEAITPSHIIAITEEGRMLLVRARDGWVHVPSLRALVGKRLLANELVADDRCISLKEATTWKGALSHDDILSLGAATYSSYPSY